MRSIVFLIIPSLLIFGACAGVGMQKVREEAKRIYPIPPEPPRTIERTPPTPPDSTDPAANKDYEEEKAKYDAEKKRIELEHKKWLARKHSRLQMRDQYVKDSAGDVASSYVYSCLGLSIVVALFIGIVAFAVDQMEWGPSWGSNSSYLHTFPLVQAPQPPVLGIRF